MTANLPAGWYPDPQDGNRTRYWDGAAWAGQAAGHEPFASPTAPSDGLLQAPAPYLVESPPQGSRGLSTGGVVGIVVSVAVAVTLLIGALLALYFMTSAGQNATEGQPSEAQPSASATSEAASSPEATDVEDTSLPFIVEEGEQGTTWMLRYDVGTLEVPSSARDVSRSAIERIKGDTSYVGGVWSFDGLSWTSTEAYLYVEAGSYETDPIETIEEVAQVYYADYWLQEGFDVSPITVTNHPAGYEIAFLEVTGLDSEYLRSGAAIPVRHSIALIRDGRDEAALSFYRLGATDATVVSQWDPQLQASVDSFRFWDDIEP